MSYCPALDWPSWKAFAKNESYGSVRNWTLIPVAFSNIGRIFSLNGVSAPSSNAPITSLPPPLAACARGGRGRCGTAGTAAARAEQRHGGAPLRTR